MKEIFVHSQEELDNISTEDDVIINIYFGTKEKPANIYKNYKISVRVYGNSSVKAYGNSIVEAYGNNIVEAYGNSIVEAYGNSSVIAYDNSSVIAYEDSSIIAYGNSSVKAYEDSSIIAHGNNMVEAYEDSIVEAYDNSSVIAYEDSSIIAYGNVQVLKMDNHQNHIKIFGNARIVYTPKNIIDFMEYHNIDHDNDTAIFYKAVHKKVTANHIEYFSNFDLFFTYEIGKRKCVDFCDSNPKKDCANGIHISTKDFALNFGADWYDLAILEVKAKIKDIIVPYYSNGKVRAPEVEVIREVPLNECGLLGKFFLRRNEKECSK